MNHFTISIKYVLSSILLAAVLVTGCSGGQQKEKSASSDYKETKQMVIDILKTKEGQKAIHEAMNERSSTQSVQRAGQGGGEEMKIQAHEMMQDPKFAVSMAKAMQEQNKKLLKDLMKEPEYQKMMLDIMKDPEYQKLVLETMKSPAYRQQTMSVMKDALQSPMFRLEMIQLAQKAQEQMIKPEQGKGKEKEKGKGKEGGGKQEGGGGKK
ncbi:spore germination lipoprotein GerD [Aneurinibacillus thermoaerophilus]|uniref:spore germination lipoprotein GerD n=1 Tax=Aneurinibacillus thermoaerophilus TaxID=143495 RepID=UPI002E21DC0E|nr:spore germination lipoprotein GerD [Aneurinibacillus thermoaerophilus]MED0679218.1 spore germination lipoprotein GerD [Aneurinibacillus thermoaerophilus]MED0765750.1 spore germination lipoprotein GerD [Aneurinibacillus thermoaerophilus]